MADGPRRWIPFSLAIASLPPAAPALLAPFRTHPATRRILEAFAAETPAAVAVAGPTGVTTTLLAAATALAHPGPVLLVTAFEDQAHAATADLLHLARGSDEAGGGGDGDTHLVVAPFDALGPRDLLGARAEGPLARRLVLAATLDHGSAGGADAEDLAANAGRWVMVASVAALLQAVPGAEAVAGAVRRIHPGDELDAGALQDLLTSTGHRAAGADAEAAGTLHVDGSAVRFRPLGAVATDDAGRASTAARAAIVVTFENDRIGSIRFADPPTDAWDRPLAALTLATPEAKRVLQRESTRCLLDLLPANTGVVLDDDEAIALEAARLGRRSEGGAGDLTPGELEERLAARPAVRVDTHPEGEDAAALEAELPVPFSRNPDAAAQELAARGRAHAVLVVSDHPDDPRLKDRLAHAPDARLLRGVLSEGFRLRSKDGDTEVVPGHELLGVPAPPEAAVEDPAPDGPPETGTLGSVLVSLEPGDALVHADHGVALFGGMEPIETGIGSRRTTLDHLTLAFAEPDTLRVPADQAARVFPFHASADAPTPDPLNGLAWAKKLALAEAAANALCGSGGKRRPRPRTGRGGRIRPRPTGSARSKTTSRTSRPPTSPRPSPPSPPTWRRRHRWTGWCAATSASARPRSRPGRSSAWSARGGAPGWRRPEGPPGRAARARPPCSPSSTAAASPRGSARTASRSACSRGCARRRSRTR